MQPLVRQGQGLTMVHQECDALMEKNIREQLGTLEKENALLREYLRDIFDHLFRLTESNPEDCQNRKDYGQCLQLLEVPL